MVSANYIKFFCLYVGFQQTISYSYFTRLGSLLDFVSDVSQSSVKQSLLLCAGSCNRKQSCLSFNYNKHDGFCQFFSKVSITRRIKSSRIVSFVTVNSGCKVPAIHKGSLLSVTGLQEGSKAWFMCDDYHIANVTHGVCRADGVWEGLKHPCVHEPGNVHVLLARGRLDPGKCFNIVASRVDENTRGTIAFCAVDMKTLMLHLSLRLDFTELNSYLNNVWGPPQSVFWPNGRLDINLTICTENNVYRFYSNGSEFTLYRQRASATGIHYVRSTNLVVRTMSFINQRELEFHTSCKARPNLPNGNLLVVNGLQEGSKAWFMCEDYHYSNISHLVCGADGLWKGLNSPCVHVDKPPYLLASSGRVVPGKCMTAMARWDGISRGSVSFLSKDKTTHICVLYVNQNKNMAVLNSYINGQWGQAVNVEEFWPDRGEEVDLTICIEEKAYRFYYLGKDKATFKHRRAVTDVHYVLVDGFGVRNLRFSDPEAESLQPPCKKSPSIPNGKVLSVDGVRRRSKIRFTCDDYHFSNVDHSVCEANGRWKGLDNLCFYKSGPPYLLLSSRRISPGKCMVMFAKWLFPARGAISFTTRYMEHIVLGITIRKGKLVTNTFINGNWGSEKIVKDFWLERKALANLTICIEKEQYKLYLNGKEKLQFKHRFLVTEVHYVRILGLAVKSMVFTSNQQS